MGEFIVYETDERMFFLKKQLEGLRPLVNTHIFAPNLVLSAERLDNVREDYINAGGLKTLLAVYWDNHSTIDVERFGAALLALLPGETAIGV